MKSAFDYIIIYSVIAVSSNISVMSFKWSIPIMTLLLILGLLLKKSFKMSLSVVTILVLLGALQLLQALQFSFLSWLSYLSTLGVYLFSFFALVSVTYFDLKFVKLVAFLTVISLINTLMCLVPGYFDFMVYLISLLGTDPIEGQNMLILTMEHATVFDFVHRNAGFTYEPGIFGLVLVIAQIFERKLSGGFHSSKSNIFQLGMLSTFSTATWAALAVILLLRVTQQNNVIKRVYGTGVILIAFGWAMFNLPFLLGKVQGQFDSVNGEYHGNRVQSTLVDLRDISSSPWVGRGRNAEVRFNSGLEATSIEKHRTNGLTDLMVEFGLIFTTVFLFILWMSLREYFHSNSRVLAIATFIMIILIGLSQTIFSRPLLLILLFLPSLNNDFQDDHECSSKDIHLYNST